MRMRKKKNLEPRMEACAALWIKDPTQYKGKWSSLMPEHKMLRLELGCGKGRFTAETAAAHPEDLYVAVERVPDAMVIAMERCRNMGLTNVFFIDGDAAVLGDYFAPDEVDLIYINFCDPWPSVKHSRRRLTAEGFLRGYRQVLKDDGPIHFKTDNHDLYEWSLFQFPKAGFELYEVTRNLHENGSCGIMTDYEEKFHSLGTPINRCVGTKVALPDVPVMDGLQDELPEWEIRHAGEEDVAEITALFQSDPDYFALEGPQPSEDTVRHDMANLPPRCLPSQKHFTVLRKDGRLCAVLDLVEGYPRERTLFVGLLLVEPQLRNQGVGSGIAEALLRAADKGGFDQVRLGCLQANPRGHAFWERAGFVDVREGTMTNGGAPVWIMEQLTGGADE